MAPVRVRETIVIPDDELMWRFSRSGGPGGQHVNTTDSRVELSFDIASSRVLTPHLRERVMTRLQHRLVGDVITVVSSEHRSQLRNREAAMQRLADLLDEALRPAPPQRRATKPSRAARARRVDAKKRRGKTKRMRRPPNDG